jgi:hypothetical protein
MTTEPRSVDEILQTLRSLVRWDARTIFDEHSNALLPPSRWPAEASLAITSVTSRELYAGSGANRILVGMEHSVRFSDRIRALELAMREAGLFADRLPLTDPSEMTDQQIAHVLYEVVSSRAPASWENKTDAEIDADYARITTCYDERRPGVRLNTPPETPPAPVQRLRAGTRARAAPRARGAALRSFPFDHRFNITI